MRLRRWHSFYCKRDGLKKPWSTLRNPLIWQERNKNSFPPSPMPRQPPSPSQEARPKYFDPNFPNVSLTDSILFCRQLGLNLMLRRNTRVSPRSYHKCPLLPPPNLVSAVKTPPGSHQSSFSGSVFTMQSIVNYCWKD